MSTDDDRQPWEVQGFADGEGRPFWSAPVTGQAGVLDYLGHSLYESDAAVFLVRRGPAVEMPEGHIGPYRLLDLTTAREDLARHLYLDSTPSMLRAGRAELWDKAPDYLDNDWAYERADAILAVLVGGEG